MGDVLVNEMAGGIGDFEKDRWVGAGKRGCSGSGAAADLDGAQGRTQWREE